MRQQKLSMNVTECDMRASEAEITLASQWDIFFLYVSVESTCLPADVEGITPGITMIILTGAPGAPGGPKIASPL